MIVKCISWKGRCYGQLLRYMVTEEHRDREFDFIITHNVKSKNNTIEEWESAFQQNEQLRKHRRKDNAYFYHFILSYAPEDTKHLTSEKLKDLTHAFISEHGIEGMYIAVPHMEKDHLHVHILDSSIAYKSGTSLRKSHAQFHALKENLQEYQKEKYPELSHSLVEHGKAKNERVMKREEILKLLRSYLSDTGGVKDEESFEALGAKIYERNGKPYGVMYKGQPYRFKALGIERKKTKEQSRLEKLKQIRNGEGKNLER